VRELSPAETLEILRTRVPSLARHHNVVVTDAAVRASIELTDLWVTDRRRPDKAIDALDEACAHIQATATYSARAEELIARRRAWVRQARRTESAEQGSRLSGAPPLDAMARTGIAALERFGAEIESALTGQRGEASSTSRMSRGHEEGSGPAAETTAAGRAALDVELERQLLDEGIVVRGHDVARVVGLMSGRRVEWEE
jgi:ATP-dependent Clp protease ATP-binding subunit ClpA